METESNYSQYSARISSELRALRKSKGFTIKDLAKVSGMTYQQVQGMESGKRSFTITSLARYLDALGNIRTLDAFMGMLKVEQLRNSGD